jgi:hypothetical protein
MHECGHNGLKGLMDQCESRSIHQACTMQDTEVDYSNMMRIGGVDIAIGMGAEKKSLPPGTKRNVFQGYEAYEVPPIDPGKLPKPQLVPISAFEHWARTAFQGYKTLNRIQSRIFQVCHLP